MQGLGDVNDLPYVDHSLLTLPEQQKKVKTLVYKQGLTEIFIGWYCEKISYLFARTRKVSCWGPRGSQDIHVGIQRCSTCVGMEMMRIVIRRGGPSWESLKKWQWIWEQWKENLCRREGSSIRLPRSCTFRFSGSAAVFQPRQSGSIFNRFNDWDDQEDSMQLSCWIWVPRKQDSDSSQRKFGPWFVHGRQGGKWKARFSDWLISPFFPSFGIWSV